MSKKEYLTFHDRRKKQIVMQILNTIKENKGINVHKLLAMLHISDPFISKKDSTEYLKDMEKVGQIIVNEKTKEVELCQ